MTVAVDWLVNALDNNLSRQGWTPELDTGLKDRFSVGPSQHSCSAYLAFVCTARTKIVAHVKDPLSTFR